MRQKASDASRTKHCWCASTVVGEVLLQAMPIIATLLFLGFFHIHPEH